jgi:long-chain acyl-CoA synthetase
MSQSLFHAFLAQVQTRPEAIAIVANDEQSAQNATSLTWLQLANHVASLAFALEPRLCESPDRHILYLHRNRLSDICVSLASMALGSVEVPIDARREIAHIDHVRQSTDGLWIDDAFVLETLEQKTQVANALEYLRSFDRATGSHSPELILWTTGTTASPKGVILSQRNLLSNAQAKLQAVPQSVDDVRLTTLPLAHAYARTCDFGTWLLSGCTLVLSLGYVGWETIAKEYPPTLANVVPSLAYRLLETENAVGMSRLRLLGVGGAPLNREAFERYRDRGITVTQGYGLTETSPVICSATPSNAAAGLVGEPIRDCEVEIRQGRLFVRGANVMLGYWQDPVATRNRIDEGGWLDTGDLAEIDEVTGQYRIIGRADDLIVLPNGNKLHPRDVESLVEELDEVAHAMLILRDESLELWLNLDTISLDDRIRTSVDVVLQRLAKWKRPKSVQSFVPPLSIERSELTHKGSLRRSAVLATRFG